MKFKLNNWKYFAVKGPFCLFDYSDHLSIVILFNILTNIIQLNLEKLWWKPAWILMAFFKVIVLVFAESPYVDKTQGWNLSNISCLTPLLTGLVLLIVLTQLLLQSHYKVKPKLSRCHSQSFRCSLDTLQKRINYIHYKLSIIILITRSPFVRVYIWWLLEMTKCWCLTPLTTEWLGWVTTETQLWPLVTVTRVPGPGPGPGQVTPRPVPPAPPQHALTCCYSPVPVVTRTQPPHQPPGDSSLDSCLYKPPSSSSQPWPSLSLWHTQHQWFTVSVVV